MNSKQPKRKRRPRKDPDAPKVDELNQSRGEAKAVTRSIVNIHLDECEEVTINFTTWMRREDGSNKYQNVEKGMIYDIKSIDCSLMVHKGKKKQK